MRNGRWYPPLPLHVVKLRWEQANGDLDIGFQLINFHEICWRKCTCLEHIKVGFLKWLKILITHIIPHALITVFCFVLYEISWFSNFRRNFFDFRPQENDFFVTDCHWTIFCSKFLCEIRVYFHKYIKGRPSCVSSLSLSLLHKQHGTFNRVCSS